MSLPESVTSLLKAKHFVHLATCFDNQPHVSLMNYAYYHDSAHHYIIISTPTNTTKYDNMTKNPKVSLLVHDWITSSRADGTDQGGKRNSLFELLTNINKAETNSVSVMLNGEAATIPVHHDRYELYKGLLLNIGFDDDTQKSHYLTNDDNALVVITVQSCKVTDVENNVQLYE